MGEFRMPSLGADMTAGTLVEWLRQPGDRVERGDIVAVVETQKGAIEIEIFESGTIDRLLVEAGTKVPVGTPLALVRGLSEEAAAPPAAPPAVTIRPPAAPAPLIGQPPAVPMRPTPAGGVAARPLASPAARRIAADRGLTLEGIAGTGPGGAIVSADVMHASKPAAAEGIGRRRGLDFGEMRKAIAAAMARSKREIPHYYLSHSIDVGAATAWLDATNVSRSPPERLLFAVLLLKAAATALRDVPELNGWYTEDGFQPAEAVHLGTAIAIRGGGLVAPAIHDADTKSLDQLMEALRDLVTRVRAGRLRSSEMTDPTVTVTSLGERGVDGLFGVIYPPQVAIVGFGTPASRPWVVDGRVEARQVISVSLAADHRVSDGHRGALFLRQLDQLLQHPERL